MEPRMPMYLIELHALPGPAALLEDVGGAYVNCWIEAADLGQAVSRAIAEVEGGGWTPDVVRHGAIITREDYAGDDDDGLEYFEQALIDKEVCVFHLYPAGSEEEDE
ncbi:hypothetical protein AY599_06670 [Leptolyngbya valderiana BDU 20041]|nr:hypothetical protein AY599_06670 [Leptolyngbya valderiana BDU 20041]